MGPSTIRKPDNPPTLSVLKGLDSLTPNTASPILAQSFTTMTSLPSGIRNFSISPNWTIVLRTNRWIFCDVDRGSPCFLALVVAFCWFFSPLLAARARFQRTSRPTTGRNRRDAVARRRGENNISRCERVGSIAEDSKRRKKSTCPSSERLTQRVEQSPTCSGDCRFSINHSSRTRP